MGTCKECGRNVPALPRSLNSLVAHVTPFGKPCVRTPVLGRVNQQTTFDHPEAWETSLTTVSEKNGHGDAEAAEAVLVSSRQTREAVCSVCLGTENVRFLFPRFICESCYKDVLNIKRVEDM